MIRATLDIENLEISVIAETEELALRMLRQIYRDATYNNELKSNFGTHKFLNLWVTFRNTKTEGK